MDTNINKTFIKDYLTPSNPISFSGARKWKQYMKQSSRFPIFAEWLSGQDAYTMHKPVIRKFRRRPTIVSGLGEQLQIDLMDVHSHSKDNNDINFLLVAIDVFSKKAYVFPLKSKRGADVANALNRLLEKEKFKQIQSDKGKEFYNKQVRDVLIKHNIKFFSSENDTVKASIIERFIRTLRAKIHRYLTYTKNNYYIDKLHDFINAYNNTIHSSTNLTPNEVTYKNQEEVWQKLYESTDWRRKSKPKYKVGDYIRIVRAALTFERGYTKKWTEEIFIISKVFVSERPIIYSIKDLDGEEIKGKFYEKEIQKVKLPKSFEIEKIITSKGSKKKKQFLVKWLGYPESFNSWINEKDLI